ncbi:MerR family transcriptional regulator [Vibrio sp. LaRot3]|uniref:MerR family transcriptional regulator n=1 Tax=Vibrio sp. LaRot3 TaxID=2998829 RepID=UPI0022CE245A|nr:MerR family transcriptional regulator [Vibrio sp. LaRot3]MDA0148990.1 MerR family transcriptional regulator [Vibrio sp. LaRot3]
MFIKEASQKSGATQRAIRLYESLGLLEVERSGKYRVYSHTNINLIKIIKEAQSLGIRLSELVALKNEQEDFDWQRVSDFLLDKQASIEVEIKTLQAQKARMEEYRVSINQCVQGLDSNP